MNAILHTIQEFLVSVLLACTVLVGSLRYLLEQTMAMIVSGGMLSFLFLCCMGTLVLATCCLLLILRSTGTRGDAEAEAGSVDGEYGMHMVPVWVHEADIEQLGGHLRMSGTFLDSEAEADCEILVVPLADNPHRGADLRHGVMRGVHHYPQHRPSSGGLHHKSDSSYPPQPHT